MLTLERQQELLNRAKELGIQPTQPVQPSAPQTEGLTEERKAQLLQRAQELGLKPQAPQPQGGFLKSMAKSILQTPASIATSAYNVAKAAPQAAQGVFQTLTGDAAGAKESQAQAEYELQKSRQIPLLGKTTPITTQYDTDAERLKKAVGAGAELASYGVGGLAGKSIIGGGLAKNLTRVGAGALEAGASGALATGGQAAAEGKSLEEIGSAVGTGLKYGLGIGGLLGAAPLAAKAAKVAAPGVKFAVGKAAGLEGSTIDTALQRGGELAEARKAGLGRDVIGKKVEGAVENIIKDISETGRAYEPVRASGVMVEIPRGYWQTQLEGAGIKLKNGIVDRKASKVMTSADKKAFDEFLSLYAKEGPTSVDDFLRAREALANVAKYDMAKSSTSSQVAKALREAANRDFRDKIPGLADLDARYSGLRTSLGDLKGLVIDKKGDVKLSSIVNSLKKGREGQLEALESLSPGITKDLELLSAIEDINYAAGNKVGAYAQNILFGGGIGFGTGGPMGALMGILVTNPKVIIPILEHYSMTSAFLKKNLGSAVEKILRGVKPNAVEAKAIENVLKQEAKDKVIIAGLLPEGRGNAIELPGPGILEGQQKLRTPGNQIDIKPNLAASQKAAGVFEQPVTGKSVSKELQPLAEEARKNLVPKTVKVWNKSKFSNDGAYVEVPVIRREDNITLYQGGSDGKRQFWTPDRKYAEQFGDVKEKTGSFYKVDNGNRVTDVYVEVPTKKSENSALKSTPKEPLIEEAQKYKSAEEFVKAQGEPHYHASTSEIGKFIDTGKPTYFSKDANFGKFYLGDKAKNKQVILDIKKTAVLDDKKLAELLKDSYFADNAKNLQEVVDNFNMSDTDVRDYVFRQLKKDGFDSAVIKNDWNGGLGSMESTVVFDPSKIKTKSQLTDIWNKANKKD